jgi:hypothetical protein
VLHETTKDFNQGSTCPLIFTFSIGASWLGASPPFPLKTEVSEALCSVHSARGWTIPRSPVIVGPRELLFADHTATWKWRQECNSQRWRRVVRRTWTSRALRPQGLSQPDASCYISIATFFSRTGVTTACALHTTLPSTFNCVSCMDNLFQYGTLRIEHSSDKRLHVSPNIGHLRMSLKLLMKLLCLRP